MSCCALHRLEFGNVNLDLSYERVPLYYYESDHQRVKCISNLHSFSECAQRPNYRRLQIISHFSEK